METEKGEGQAAKRSRISPGALTEIENALRDYDKELWELGQPTGGITEATIKTYSRAAEKFVAWLRYEFAPGTPTQGLSARPWMETPKIQRLAAKKSRISLQALEETQVTLDKYVREVLQAKVGERTTNQLGDGADYFVRWLRYEFAPGARKGLGRKGG
jgi:hypothetical protein